MIPEIPKPKVDSRIIMTAENAKRLLIALQDNISKFEDQFGEITIHTNEDGAIPLAFGNNPAEA